MWGGAGHQSSCFSQQPAAYCVPSYRGPSSGSEGPCRIFESSGRSVPVLLLFETCAPAQWEYRTMSEGNPNRDIRNHYLFEIATEVANRGMSRLTRKISELTLVSGWHLLCDQVESPRHHRRIWRSIYSHRASQ